LVLGHSGRRKALASLLMIISWNLWNKRNVRTVRNKSTLPIIIPTAIKLEAKSWALARTKHLGNLLPGE
jgi:hypothetical protein